MFAVFRNLFSVFLLFSVFFSSSQAFSASERHNFSSVLDELAPDEAYVLVNLSTAGDYSRAIHGFELVDSDAGNSVIVPAGESGIQLIKVKAGTYRLGAMYVSMRGDLRTKSLSDADKVKGIDVAAQTITYIGDWKLSNVRYGIAGGDRITVNAASYRINYDPQLLAQFGANLEFTPQYTPAIASANGNGLRGKWVQDAYGAIAGVTYY